MSLILEALRKSEAERRRGQAPGLFVEQVRLPERRRDGTPAWAWALMLLLAVVLLAWGWREFDLRAPASMDTAANGSSSEGSAMSRPIAPTAADYPQRLEGADAPPTRETATRETPAPRDEAAPERDARTAATAPQDAPGIAPASHGSANRVSGSPSAGADTAQNEPGPTNAGAARDTLAAASDPPPPGTPLPASAQAAPPAPASDEESLPRLSELTGDERSGLPALKLSMHVYADDPAQRFVIVDGRRLREGDSPAAGIAVEAIRRDGLVLSVNGRRVLLARP
jgi:general secretion pathway protein B